MRPQKVDDQQLMAGLLEVIRAKGFEGASMNDLAEATGLKKASLYHRFPGGKQEITEAVLNFTGAWSKEHILSVLTDQHTAPSERLTKVIGNIKALYRDGEAICILRSLTMDPSLPLFATQLQNSFQTWLSGFTQLGLDLGFGRGKAEQLARETVIKVQGSLVLSKALNDLNPFQQSLQQIEQAYST